MATKRKGKTNPCEGCRERKKKCSAGLPCDRCRKLGIECHYLKEVEPPKVSTVEMPDRRKLEQHVQIMQACMDDMEQELQSLGNKTLVCNTSEPQDQNVIARWKATMREGVMSIDTNITSYAALLDQIKSLSLLLSPTLIKQPTFTLFAKDTGFLKRHILNAAIRRGHFRATLECVKNVENRKALPSPTINKQHQNQLAVRLINIYFSCRFLTKVTFHQKTFYDLFVHPYPDLESSPVVCALAAVVLTKYCTHIIAIAPHSQQLVLAEFYFNKARQSISLKFDEPSLETMITFTQMARYMTNLLRPQEANTYLDMAIRIHRILTDTDYRSPPTDTTDSVSYACQYETFKRCYTSIQEVNKAIQFIRNQRGVPLGKHRPSNSSPQLSVIQANLSRNQLFQPTPMPDEAVHVVRAIKKDIYMSQMARIVGPFFHRVRWAEDDMVPTAFLVETEEQLKHLYYSRIPLDYQLASFISEDGLTDAEFRRRLNQHPHIDLASVSIAIMYYQSLIALYEPFLPVIPKPNILSDLAFLQDIETPSQNQLKRKFSCVSESSLPSPASESSPKMAPLSALSVYSARAQTLTHQNAIIVVRLLEYQCTVLGACDMSIASLLCAWDILMRNSCLGMSEEDFQAYGIAEYLTKKDIQLAREYAVRSIEVLRRGCLFNEAERGLWEYYERIEKQLLDALYKTASPTAKYWEPVSCWYR